MTFPLVAQQSTPVFDAQQARHVITAGSARQSVIFENLLPGQIYSLIVPGGDVALSSCMPDLSVVTPKTQVIEYDAAAPLLTFAASSPTMEFRLDYPCAWEASNPPRHYISMMRTGGVKEKPPGIPQAVPTPLAENIEPLLQESGLGDTLRPGPDSGGVAFFYTFNDPCNSWTVTGTTSWLTATVSGNLDLSIYFTQNLSVYPRTATLTVSGCGHTMVYVVIQSGARLKTAPANADSLIRKVFRGGDCSDIQNVTLSGQNSQIGWFSNGLTSVGFDSGVIIASGDVSVAPGPNDQDGASGGFGAATPDADLSQLTNGALFDKAAIEFDFTPTQSPVTFNFAFASEEYCEYVGSQFNDMFGFFISGPGIPNGQQNIALVPATSIPVAINTVNHVANSGYYVNNQPASSNDLCGQQAAGGPAVNAIQYDGFTKVFTAIANVQTCQTYHIKLKIADVGDGVWDSAVFLKAGSFDAGAEALVRWEVNGNPNIDEVCESCAPVKLVFERVGGNLNLPVPVSFAIGGTAIMGVDYSTIASTVVIPAGQTKVELPVSIYSDNLIEGQETIVITLNNACSCLNPQKVLKINDLQSNLPPPCPSNDFPAADLCSDVCIFCNFNGYQGTTIGFSGQTPPAFCGTIENEQWLGFVAGATAATFTATPSNCANGNGIQLALYSDCNSSPIACNGGASGGGDTPVSITTTLTPGVAYRLLIDGFAGDQCDFTLNVVPPSAVQAPNVGNAGVISGPAQVCPGGTATYSVPPVTGAGAYIWNAPADWLINGQPPPVTTFAPGGNAVAVTAGNSNGTLCVQPVNVCNQALPVCKNVVLQPIPVTTLPTVTVCAEDIPYPLPWGDLAYSSGTYETTLSSYNGCDSVIRIPVQVKQPIVRFLAPQAICAGSCVTVCGEQYCDAGNYSHTCESYQGCDSVINFSILVIEPVAQIIPNGALSCNNTSMMLNSAPSPGTKVWKTGNGQVIGNGNSLTITQAGTYYLTVTASAGGVFCVATDTIVITGGAMPAVAITGGIIGCGATQAQLNATTDAASPQYLWSPATGLSAINIANPTADLPGVYTVVVTDNATGCTASASVTVVGNTTPPPASAVGGTISCAISSTTITASSSAQNAGYAWAGPPPFTSNLQNPAVTVPGTYTVTVTDPLNNCTSSATATVSADFAPPVAAATFDEALACGTNTVALDGSGSSAGPNFMYNWTANPGQIVSGAATLNPVVTPEGIYTLEVTDTGNGCTAAATVTVACDSVPTWTVDTTGNNHTIILPATLTGDLHPGDYVGVFFDSSGTLKCGGFGIWPGTNTAFTAYGDDAVPPAQNGFKTGELFRVKVWRPAMFPHEVDATAEYAPVGSLSGLISHTDKFGIDGISMITALTAGVTQAIPLKSGWNLISTYIIPDHPAIVDVFAPVVNSIYEVKECDGSHFYLPPAMINNFGNWDLLQGYQVKTNQQDTLRVVGQKAVPGNHPIPLQTGWQCIAYLRDTPKGIETVFGPIKGQISAVKDGDGLTYLPQFNINNIGNMTPGKGYKVKALSDVVLTYPNNLAGPADDRSDKQENAETVHFEQDKLVNSGNNATLILTASIAGSMMQPGDEIGIFTPAGKLCGAANYAGKNLAITVWGDDPGTAGILEGLQNGEAYALKVWNTAEQAEYPAWVTLAGGSNAYQPDALEEIGSLQLGSSGSEELVRAGIQSLGIYPNPASDRLNIGIESSHAGKVVLSVYNLNGARVLDAEEIAYQTGSSIHVLRIASSLPPGMYWLKFQFEKGILYRYVFFQK